MRFASLGACGPDFLYLLMDYGSDAQDLANLLVRAAAAFDSLASLMAGVQERIDGLVSSITMGVSDSIKEQAGLLSAVIQEGLFATLASGGFNPFAFFEARRQTDYPREEWFWADVLHYWRSGRFAENLVREANRSGNPNLIAYALGYSTHYVTDVVGHPFVNQVVGGPVAAVLAAPPPGRELHGRLRLGPLAHAGARGRRERAAARPARDHAEPDRDRRAAELLAAQRPREHRHRHDAGPGRQDRRRRRRHAALDAARQLRPRGRHRAGAADRRRRDGLVRRCSSKVVRNTYDGFCARQPDQAVLPPGGADRRARTASRPATTWPPPTARSG